MLPTDLHETKNVRAKRLHIGPIIANIAALVTVIGYGFFGWPMYLPTIFLVIAILVASIDMIFNRPAKTK